MRERIEAGEPATVFASADYGHPETLRVADLPPELAVGADHGLAVLARWGFAALDPPAGGWS
jgi:hypothetical protein